MTVSLQIFQFMTKETFLEVSSQFANFPRFSTKDFAGWKHTEQMNDNNIEKSSMQIYN